MCHMIGLLSVRAVHSSTIAPSGASPSRWPACASMDVRLARQASVSSVNISARRTPHMVPMPGLPLGGSFEGGAVLFTHTARNG